MIKTPKNRMRGRGAQVLKSIDGGAETSAEVAAELGISLRLASAHLCTLVNRGYLVLKPKRFYRYGARPLKRYSPADVRQQA